MKTFDIVNNAGTKWEARASVTVSHDGSDYSPGDAGYRQRYAYSIATSEWEYVGNDIRSGVGADVDIDDAARNVFSFLYACAESRRYPNGENADLFPEYVGEWAEQNSDELSMLSINPAEFDA